MPQRFRFTLTTDAAGIAQSDSYLTNGYLVGVGYTPESGQTGALTLRDDAGALLTVADISTAGYDPDGSQSKTLPERPIVGAFVAQVTGGVNAKTVDVLVDVASEGAF